MTETHMESRDQIKHWASVWGTVVTVLIGVTGIAMLMGWL